MAARHQRRGNTCRLCASQGELLKAVRLDIAPAKDNSVDKDKPEKETQGHKVETKSDPVVVDADADADTKVESDPVVVDANADTKDESDPVVVDADAKSDPVVVDADADADTKVETESAAVDADAKVDAPQPASEPKKRGKASK